MCIQLKFKIAHNRKNITLLYLDLHHNLGRVFWKGHHVYTGMDRIPQSTNRNTVNINVRK